MGKRYKRTRNPHKYDEVKELPYKAFEEKLKKAGVTCFIRIRKRPKVI